MVFVMEMMMVSRKKIDDIDAQIIHLLAQRFALVAELGLYKRQHNISSRDDKRWKEVLQSRIRLGNIQGLNESFIGDLRERIHQESLQIQQSQQ